MKKFFPLCALLCLVLAVSACALEYSVEAPGDPEYGKATSVEPVATADRGETPNVDVSKDTAVLPPPFGSSTSRLPVSGVIVPSAPTDLLPNKTPVSPGYTKLTPDLFYSAGHLGTLKIPSLGLIVKLYQGTDSAALKKGVGHFEDTSVWDGNVCIAGHNRGVNSWFGQIHTLKIGDRIIFTTKLGTRIYAVSGVYKISETDTSALAPTVENRITFITCVRDQSTYRWAVSAVEVQ